MNKSFQEQLREYDKALAKTPLRPAAEQRIRNVLQGQTASQRARARWAAPRWAIGAALSCAVALGVLVHTQQDFFGSAQPPLGANCQVTTAQGAATQYLGQCELRLPNLMLATEVGTRLAEQAGKVTVHYGVARFEVEPVVAPTPPVEVTVAGGVIRVLGTSFTVRQTSQGGVVQLNSGQIAFLAPGKATVHLSPGDQLTWNETQVAPAPAEVSAVAALSAAQVTAVLSPAAQAAVPRVPKWRAPTSLSVPLPSATALPPAAATLPTATASAAALGIADVIELRAQGQYAQAFRVLTELQSQRPDARTREVLSFEKGKLLERLAGAAQVCEHWRAHQARYPSGRYSQTVRHQLQVHCALETSSSVAGE